MFPYNKAINRNIRRGKRRGNMDGLNKDAGAIAPKTEEEEILWDFEEYKLTYVLDNFKLPQIVQVVEGFMFTEEDSLASGTVLTIHGQQKIEQVCAIEENGSGSDVYVPLSCPYRVRVVAPNREKIYRTVKDLCNATPLPKCVLVHEKIVLGGIKIPSGRWLIVKSISKNKNDQAEGISVELLDGRIRTFVLPLKVVGNFAPCPLPADQSRNYFIRELCDRSFPIWIKFLASAEKNPPYGPHMGVLKLIKQQTIDVVFSTTEIEGQKFAISFSRSLPVTVTVARGSLDCTETYSRRCKAAEEEVDIDVLSHLTDSNPYSCMYQSAIYADVCAIRKAFQERSELGANLSLCSSDSFQSDTTSFSEDKQSEGLYKANKSIQSNGSIPHHHYDNPSSISSSEGFDLQNHARKSTQDFAYNTPSYIYLDPIANIKRSESCEENNENNNDKDDDDENDYEEPDEHEYVEIVETMDSNISKPVKQTKADHKYTYVDVTPLAPCAPSENSRRSERRKHLSEAAGDGQNVPFTKSISLTSSEESGPSAGPYASKRNLSRTVSETAAESLINSEQLISFLDPFSSQQGQLTGLVYERPFLEYQTPSSDRLVNTADPVAKQDYTKRVPPKKPERPKRPPKPLPRKSSLQNEYLTQMGKNFAPSNTPAVKVVSDTDKCAEEIKRTGVEAEGLNVTNTEETKIDKNRKLEQQKNMSLEELLTLDILAGESEVAKIDNIDYNDGDGNYQVDNHSYINELDEDGVGEILDEIQLSEFRDIFKKEQVNGALLISLDIKTLVSLGMNTFQSVKVVDYVQRRSENEAEASDANECARWSTRDVFDRMNDINLKSFAEFCVNNQVDGKLLRSIIDNNVFDCIRSDYSVALNHLHQMKVERYLKQGWRPDASLKRS